MDLTDFDKLHCADAGEDASSEEVEYGPEVMAIAEFNEACMSGAYTSDDGVGYYGTAALDQSVLAPCDGSAFEHDIYTHVWWYGK